MTEPDNAGPESSRPGFPGLSVAVCALSAVVMLWAAAGVFLLPAEDFDGWDDLVALVKAKRGDRKFQTLPFVMQRYLRIAFSDDDFDFAQGRRRLAPYLIAEDKATPLLRRFVENRLDRLIPRAKQVELFANLVSNGDGSNMWEISQTMNGLQLDSIDSGQFLNLISAVYYEDAKLDYEAHPALAADLKKRFQRLGLWPPPPRWGVDKFGGDAGLPGTAP